MFFTEPHNYYLKVASELGAVGIAAFLALLSGVAMEARRAWKASDRAEAARIRHWQAVERQR